MSNNIEHLKRQVLDGDISPLKFYSMLQDLEKAIKEAKEEILDSAITEFERYGTSKIKEYGFEISLTKSDRYDYSGSSVWTSKKESLSEIEEKMKHAAKAGGTVIDESTGEVIEPAIYLANKESLKFTKLK